MNIVRVTGGLLLGFCFALNAHALGQSSDEVASPELKSENVATAARERAERWVDSSHRFATDRTMALTRWVDSFFGDMDGDAEIAESRLRLKITADWDERLGTETRVSVGGKVNLPRLADRVDLVFRGDDPDELVPGDEDDPSQSQVGLQVMLDESASGNHRTDFTVGLSGAGPKPGVKYRYKTLWGPNTSFRFSQRAQYDFDDGGFATTKLDIDYALSRRSLIRTQNRVLYGENSDGAEWSSNIGVVRQWAVENGFERAAYLYAGIRGHTEPDSYGENYQVGLRLRAQAIREFLFFELEPTLSQRIDAPNLPRETAWAVEARVEFLLFD
ncbi:MAG: hypothetical protein GWP37_01560 [Gammaproteobacteria bacterium]|nr:hypothetical protein [Gammaproteobacteria bacterium]